jgi:Protein of unknown function (DUF3150)
MSVLQDVVVVSLDVHIWSGRKKLRPEDLTVSGKLPPKDLVSLGSKKIFDPRALKPFGMEARGRFHLPGEGCAIRPLLRDPAYGKSRTW